VGYSIVKTLRLALESDYQGVLNLGAGITTQIDGLVEQVKSICDVDVTVHNEPERVGDIIYSLAGMNALKSALGFVPQTSIGDGLQGLKDCMVVD